MSESFAIAYGWQSGRSAGGTLTLPVSNTAGTNPYFSYDDLADKLAKILRRRRSQIRDRARAGAGEPGEA